jgi:hypothetical protein
MSSAPYGAGDPWGRNLRLGQPDSLDSRISRTLLASPALTSSTLKSVATAMVEGKFTQATKGLQR